MSKNSDGSEVYTWGQGVLGQLGHGDEKTQRQPRLVVAFLGFNVKQVSCGNQHTAVLMETGELFTFGRGNFGQLGQGASVTANVSVPALISALQGKFIKQVACGWHHTAALLDNGQLFTWGSGEYGRLGHGDEIRQASPKLVDTLNGKPVASVAAGGFHTAAIVEGGNLYTWGGGYFGQLGHGDETDRKTPKVVKGVQQCVAHQVACGTHHTLMLTEEQQVWTWGSGEFGKLGIGDEDKHAEPILITKLQGINVTEISTGGFHSAALSNEGVLYTWGGGDKGQLGHGDENMQTVPVVVEALRGKRVTRVSAGMHHTMVMLDNGDVFSWGSGEYGRLGHDDEQMQTTPVFVEALQGKGVKDISAGGFHSMALASGDGGKGGGAAGQPYVPSKKTNRIGFSAAEEEGAEEDEKGRPQTAMTGVTEDSAGDNESRAASRMSARPGAKGATGGGGKSKGAAAAGDDDDDQEDYKLKQALRESQMEVAELRKQTEILVDRAKLEQTRIETRLQASQEERNHLRKQLERLQEKQQADAALKAKLGTAQEEIAELRKKYERARGDLKQRTVDVHMLQVRVAQLCGSELDGLTVSQLEELERMQAEALRRCGVAKYVRLRQEFQEKEEHMREDVEKMRREFEERMEKMKSEVQKIQEEKVHLMGLEQRLRQEFQTQVQAEQMSNEELRIRLETLQDGFVQLRSIMRKDKQSRVESERNPLED
jgi:alpha-tubulin suppressor-like RCC1 family protein